MKRKKWLSLLLALLMVATALPFSALAVSAAETSPIKSV
jgi:hypothetical protein